MRIDNINDRGETKVETNEDVLLDTIEQYKKIVETLERSIDILTSNNNVLLGML